MINGTHETQAKKQLARPVQSHLEKLCQPEEASQCKAFFDIFWRQLALADWEHKEVSDIAGCIYSLWLLVRQNRGEVLVQVFNPSLEEHRWLCNGTAVMVSMRDMPFLVDTLRMEISRRAWPIHIIKSTLLNVQRDNNADVMNMAAADDSAGSRPENSHWHQEALIYIEIGLIAVPEEMSALNAALKDVLSEVIQVVEDYRPTLATVDALTANLELAPDPTVSGEAQAFLRWITDNHFTFLGYREFDLDPSRSSFTLKEVKERALGMFRHSADEQADSLNLSAGVLDFYAGNELVAFSKSASRSRVHRDVYPDYIAIKRHNADGEVIGEGRLLGIFTYAVYTLSPQLIPLIREKVQAIVARSELVPKSHDGKNLIRVLETFPREELFQADHDALYIMALGVSRISERRVVRLFSRKDPFGKFVNCIVYVPRDLYNTRIRQKIEQIIAEAVNALGYESTTYFSESSLARAHLVFRVDHTMPPDVDWRSLEAAIVEITRGWAQRFESALIDRCGEATGLKLARLYNDAFSAGYQENYDARVAVQDIAMMESLRSEQDIAMHFFHDQGQPKNLINFKVMRRQQQLELSQVIPVLEHLGMRVLGEHPFKVRRQDGVVIWMHEFELSFSLNTQLEVFTVRKLFEQAFAAIWQGKAESDAFNRLVLGARLHWREVVMLRAYAAYMKQTAFNFSLEYIADTLANQLEVTRNLVALFRARFEPRLNEDKEKAHIRIQRLQEKIIQSLESIQNLNEDKILRRYFDFISATLRTNFFQKDSNGEDKDYVSLKFSPRELGDIPRPKPLFEIFVYSPRVEGVHLRGGKVARGGIRWSDRLQDYRTEVLGLVKAQQVKNAVIVPTGAKGGFVARRIPTTASREDVQAEGIACYEIFIRGLLDLTDNYVAAELVPPAAVICWDEPDPYLVVAADKGTATFSDIANRISLAYNHWLGDAFASGGSQGYDHKKMGITARGAWVSVQRHFRELGLDVQKEEFTVVGIGDMSGDVFGNGMLRSEKIRLTAAFNHQHIFIDPDPDAAQSFAERKRLFELPKSGWGDYDVSLISRGGGVFSRSAKSIDITPEMQDRFAIEARKLAPNDLVSAILKAPVDLLWNGGIGTYVKAAGETHTQVGDKTNDSLRVNGGDLRCRVIGEGGNLGMTQLGRVEYALGGGACNTDFIDNSGGVDCSDHEVNIKILLDEMIAAGDLTTKQRNRLLVEMTGAVAELVLENNYRQTLALSLAQHHGAARLNEYRRFIHYLENMGKLDRMLEFLPADDEILERAAQGGELTRAELAILLCYAKVTLKERFVEENIADDDYVKRSVATAFPAVIAEQYPDPLYKHRLLKEIVATQVANDLINTLGITGAQRLTASTGASYGQIALAFMMVKEIFNFEAFRSDLKNLDDQLPASVQIELMAGMVRRLRRAIRWFLRNRPDAIDPEEEIAVFRRGLREVIDGTGDSLNEDEQQAWQQQVGALKAAGLMEPWLSQVSMPSNLFSGLSIIEVAKLTGNAVADVTQVFRRLYNGLKLDAFVALLSDVRVESYWQALARESFLDDVDRQLRKLSLAYFQRQQKGSALSDMSVINLQSDRAKRWLGLVDELQAGKTTDFAMFSVAGRELVDLANNPEYSAPAANMSE